METSPFKPLSFSLISSYKRSMGPNGHSLKGLFLALGVGLEVAFQNDSSVLKCLFHQWSLNVFWHCQQKMMSLCSTH